MSDGTPDHREYEQTCRLPRMIFGIAPIPVIVFLLSNSLLSKFSLLENTLLTNVPNCEKSEGKTERALVSFLSESNLEQEENAALKCKPNYDLQQTIASLTIEVEKINVEVNKAENDALNAKTSLEDIFGAAFVDELEKDPDWQVDSGSFETKYLNHSFPRVADVATLVKRAYDLSVRRSELKQRLKYLKEDNQHVDYLPGELFRFIQQLRTEMESKLASLRLENQLLKDRVTALEAIQAKKEEEEREEERLSIIAMTTFDLFSNPAQTTWNPVTSTLTYFSGREEHNYAICSVPLPEDRPFRWKVEITSLPNNHGLVLGLIGKDQRFREDSNEGGSCYGWGCVRNVFAGGGHSRGQGGWAGWQQGDRGLFTYNPVERTLSLKLERTNTLYTLENLPSAYTAHIHCNLANTNIAFHLSAAE